VSSTVQQGFPPVPEDEQNEKEHRRKLARQLNRINQGKFNCSIDITLRASQTTTTLTDARIFATSLLLPDPMTANASTALLAGIWFSNRIKGSATINHASNAATDQTFRIGIFG
jgi:hypothetical protein